MVKKFRTQKVKGTSFEFSNFLNEPIVALALLVLALIALMLAVLNFLHVVYAM